MKKILIYSILVFVIVSCNSFKVSTSNVNHSYNEIVQEKLGQDVLYLLNKPETYVLCIKETEGTSQQPRNTINYLVIKTEDNSVVLENKVNGGTVAWASKNEIEVFLTPGMIRKDQTQNDFITLYNVETGKSYPKKNREQH